MFTAYTGLRGAGKSYAATLLAKQTLCKGRKVWANYPLDFTGYNGRVPVDKCYFATDIDDLAYMRNGLFIVDEAHWLLSARTWQKLKLETHQYLAQSRKLDMDIVLITQSFARLDTVARELVEVVREFIHLGKLHIWREYLPVDIDAKKRKNVGWGFFWRQKRIEKAYDTMALFGELLRKLPERQFSPNGRPIDPKSHPSPFSAQPPISHMLQDG